MWLKTQPDEGNKNMVWNTPLEFLKYKHRLLFIYLLFLSVDYV